MTSREFFAAVVDQLVDVYREDRARSERAVIRWAASLRGTWQVQEVQPYQRAAWMRCRPQAWLWEPPRRVTSRA